MYHMILYFFEKFQSNVTCSVVVFLPCFCGLSYIMIRLLSCMLWTFSLPYFFSLPFAERPFGSISPMSCISFLPGRVRDVLIVPTNIRLIKKNIRIWCVLYRIWDQFWATIPWWSLPSSGVHRTHESWFRIHELVVHELEAVTTCVTHNLSHLGETTWRPPFPALRAPQMAYTSWVA